MPSRRRVVAALGAVVGSMAGCTAEATTTGTVTRKDVTVAVPRRDGGPVDASVAFLAFEPDRGLVHGEYDPSYVDAAVAEGTLDVSQSAHARLADAFDAVRYAVNVVPTDGTPANGVVDREAFADLALGGTATVRPFTGDDGIGRLAVRDATPPTRKPAEIAVRAVDIAARINSSKLVSDG